MTTQTYILSKDTALEDSIATLQQKLLDADFNIIEESWLNPVVNLWSIRIRDRDCSLLFSSGHGTSKKAALASALGEFVERLSTHYFWTDCYFGGEVTNNKFVHYPKEQWFETNTNGSWPDGVLDTGDSEELRDFYNLDGELSASTLIDINSGDRERGICCVPYEQLRTGEMVNFPVNIIDNLYVSNGMAAGNSVEEARLHALSEIIERFVKFKIIAEGISLPDVPEQVLNRYPDIKTTIKEIEAAGYTMLVKDASLNGKYPVIAVTLLNPHDQSVHASFGAHPKFEVALQRSFTELLQGRRLDQTIGFQQAGFDMDEISSPQNLEAHFIDSSGIVAWSFFSDKSDYEFFDWSNNSEDKSTSEELNQLCDTIHSEGNDIFISDHNEVGVYACRVIVPGMSEIYPADDLVWENNNAGMEVRGQIFKADKTVEECEKLIQDIEDLNLGDEYLVSRLIGMPGDEGSIFADLCVSELITILALKVQDNERIQEGCEWLLDFRKTNPKRLKVYQCINTLLQLEGMTSYGKALENLYTRTVLKDALALIDGEDVFPLFSDWEMYGSLIEAYKKMIKAS